MEESYDYYPYGEEFGRQSSGTASSSQPYRFSGKEDQGRFGLNNYLDFGARMLSKGYGRWNSMDPLAEKFYSVSPYAYCNGNPVIFVDPDGLTIWNISQDGTTEQKRASRRDVVRSVNNDGRVLHRISFAKNSLSLEKLLVGKNTYMYFSTADDNTAKVLFEFVSLPSTWNQSDCSDNSSVINENAIIYTDKGNAVLLGGDGRVPTPTLALRFIQMGASFLRIDHVHPNNNPFPSGTGDKNSGDIWTIQYLKEKGIKFISPGLGNYNIFIPQDKSYHPYDEFSTLEIEPSIVTAY